MKWFRRRQEPEFEIVTNDVPLSTVSRWYLYDTGLAEDTNELAELIGLTRVSDEGEIKEQEDSDQRMENAAPLFPFLNSMAELSAGVMSALHVNEMVKGGADSNDEEIAELIDSMQKVYKVVALSTLMGTFSTALELGIVTSSTVSSSTFYMERDDDE